VQGSSLKVASDVLPDASVIWTQLCTPFRLFGCPGTQLMDVASNVTFDEHHLKNKLHPFWLADVQ
jgi:hypothetical protein